MYQFIRNSMAAERKHALKDGHEGVIWMTQKAGQGSCHHSGVMRNLRTIGFTRASSQPFMGDGASHRQLGRRSRFCACSARRCRKGWRRIATTRGSDRRALRTSRRCDTRSQSLPCPRARDARRSRRCGLRARHRPPLEVPCRGGRERRWRPCAIHRLNLAPGLSAGRGRRGVASTSICRDDGGPRRLRSEATR